jgi:hypothetical protein
MSTPGPSVVNPSNQQSVIPQKVTKPGVRFNNIPKVAVFKNNNSPNTIPSQRPPTSSKSALKPIIASAQETISVAETVVSGGPETISVAETVVSGGPETGSKDNTNSTKKNSKNSNNSNNSTDSTLSNESNQSNENTEEPEIKSITIYNKTFLVETKVEDPLTEEQERLALHLRLPEFEGKDDEWRHSVLREVIQGCTGDFSVTVGAQCHSFRSYLEELAQKVFDEDMPIVWEGEEETKEDETSGKKKKMIRNKEGEGDKEYKITISIPLDDLRNLLTSMDKPMTLNEAKGIADKLYKVFPKDLREKLYNIIINNGESPFRNTPQTKNTANSREFAKIISPTYAGSEPLSNTIEQLKVNNILLTDAQKLKLYTIFIDVMNKINLPYTLG